VFDFTVDQYGAPLALSKYKGQVMVVGTGCLSCAARVRGALALPARDSLAPALCTTHPPRRCAHTQVLVVVNVASA
jgi:hypothetical protein